MTEETLIQGNNLRSRIKEVKNLLSQLDLTDPSRRDAENRVSPIMLQAGMAQTIQFDVVNSTNHHPTEIELLDNTMHNRIVGLLQDYQRQLEEKFKNLS